MRARARERSERALQAYHDGELGALARRRLERRLARSPELRSELEALRALGALVRERGGVAPVPDLWASISARLPAAEGRRAEALAPGRFALPLPRLARPLGALAAVGAAALALLLLAPEPAPEGGVVRWLDSRGTSVLVLEDDPRSMVTVIWVLDPLGEAG